MDDLWPHLGRDDRRALAFELAARRRGELSKLPNVVSVGEGIRVVNGKWTSDPCLRVLVRRKWTSRARRPGSVPTHLATYVRIRGRRRRVLVPCDVEPMAATRLHAGGSACHSSDGTRSVTGTACCVLRLDGSAATYVMGCNHVLGLTLRGPPVRSQFSGVRISIAGRDVGHLYDYASPAFYDAALGLLTSQLSPLVDDGGTLRRLSGNATGLRDIPATYRILRSTGTPAIARYHTIAPWEQCGYGGGATCYRFRHVLFSEYLEGFADIGDSGAPLVDAAGYLIGMHFGGNARFSVAFPIYELLRAFSRDARLVT